MSVFHPRTCALMVAVVIACAIPANAQQPAAPDAQAIRSEIEQLKQDFAARLAALESRLTQLEGQSGAGTPAGAAGAVPGGAAGTAPGISSPGTPEPPVQAAAPAAPATAPTDAGSSLPVYGNASAASKIFNPDAAVIGNFVGAAGKNRVNPLPSLALPESELSLQAVVDPYARADFFFSFGEEGVAVEEGYLTFPALPGGLLAKIGRQYQAFGKANTLHAHVLPWPDRPLVTTNLLGGDEPLADAGISVARLIPNPWMFLEATGQVFRGAGNEVFSGNRRRDLSYVGHIRGYQDISESTNVDIGGSYAFGHNDAGDSTKTSLLGIDATLRWRPLQRAIYHSFVGRGEVIWRRTDLFVDEQQRSSGFYVSGDYQLGRRWFAGVRFDRSGRPDSAERDSGQAFTVTYWPSEFSQIRTQFRRTAYAEGEKANEVLFQFQFAIGAHGAHPF